AADELALDIELGDRRPVAELLDALAQAGVGQHIEGFELDAELAQHLHHRGGEAALREHGRALHIEHDIVVPDVLLDALNHRIAGHRLFSCSYAPGGTEVCSARA